MTSALYTDIICIYCCLHTQQAIVYNFVYSNCAFTVKSIYHCVWVQNYHPEMHLTNVLLQYQSLLTVSLMFYVTIVACSLIS